ncbi:hypothetical protein L6R52_36155 [Myxococcota bacterium]|nr:hypothetical protein [Myxococcota bacterium]
MGARGLCIGVLFAGLVGCGPEELNGGANVVCEEIGRTIANVSWSCGLSLAAANARGRGFVDGHTCTGPTTVAGEYLLEVGLACPVAMGTLPCSIADAAGDDYDQWLAAVPACDGIVVEGGGGS